MYSKGFSIVLNQIIVSLVKGDCQCLDARTNAWVRTPMAVPHFPRIHPVSPYGGPHTPLARPKTRRDSSGVVQHAVVLRHGGAGAATRLQWSTPRRRGCGEWVGEWMQAQRWFERKARAVIFFYFCADGNVTFWAVRRASRPTNARPNEMDALPTAFSLIKS
jgi:hypothetical protein